MNTEAPIRLFRPSSGTQGDIFISEWCGNCAHDRPSSEGLDICECSPDEVCGIIARTMAYDVDDPKYPNEWRYGRNGSPICTAFLERGSDIPPARCALTIDMFEDRA